VATWPDSDPFVTAVGCTRLKESGSSYTPGQAGWSLTCGTSEATPEFAAIVALADQAAGHRRRLPGRQGL
jgi:subtilase family serine protease